MILLASSSSAAAPRHIIVLVLLFFPLSTVAFIAIRSSSSSFSSSCITPSSTSSKTTTTTTLAMSNNYPRSVEEMEYMEATVRRYFQGVNEKNPDMIYSCFGETAIIRDVCALTSSSSSGNNNSDSDDNNNDNATVAAVAEARRVNSIDLVERCMDFLVAHPDCVVQFHYGPECGRRPPHWVFVHWYETGTWTGTSQGIGPPHQPPGVPEGRPMHVEGQTRFLVDPERGYTIQEFIVTRTFTEWEKALLDEKKRKGEKSHPKMKKKRNLWDTSLFG